MMAKKVELTFTDPLLFCDYCGRHVQFGMSLWELCREEVTRHCCELCFQRVKKMLPGFEILTDYPHSYDCPPNEKE